MAFWMEDEPRASFLSSTRIGCSLQDAALAAGWDPEETLRVVLQGTADRAGRRRTREAAFVAEVERACGEHRASLVEAMHRAATKGTVTKTVTKFADGTTKTVTTQTSPDGKLAREILEAAHRERAVRATLAAQLTAEGGGVLTALAAARAAAAHGDSDLVRLAQRLVQAESQAVEALAVDPSQRPPVTVDIQVDRSTSSPAPPVSPAK
jgi:hypothetical protein